MKEAASDLNQRIAARVRELRAAHDVSLDALAVRSGVSRSMISLIERGESSPTAIVLEKLARALHVPLASLFDAPSAKRKAPSSPVSRRDEQTEWKDPASGYIRRNVSPPTGAQGIQIVEVRFPAGVRVAFENRESGRAFHQQIWMLDGAMNITVGKARHRLLKGDCLEMQIDQPTMFHNPTRKLARYAVVIAPAATTRR
jgi:transcriptional regulator with XRE-family HTH domain